MYIEVKVAAHEATKHLYDLLLAFSCDFWLQSVRKVLHDPIFLKKRRL